MIYDRITIEYKMNIDDQESNNDVNVAYVLETKYNELLEKYNKLEKENNILVEKSCDKNNEFDEKLLELEKRIEILEKNKNILKDNGITFRDIPNLTKRVIHDKCNGTGYVGTKKWIFEDIPDIRTGEINSKYDRN